jgi:hypothetical protein
MKIKKEISTTILCIDSFFFFKDIRTTKEKKNAIPNLPYSPLTVTYRVELLFAQKFTLQADVHKYISKD